jgi:hypothetical protein
MTYEEFLDFVRAKCMYETIYDDSDGRTILVIRMLDAYKFITQWQGLTDEEIHDCFQNRGRGRDGLKTRKLIAAAIEAILREKNT